MKNILDPSNELMFLMYCGNVEDRSEFPSQVELLEAWRQRTPNAEKLLNDFEFSLKKRSLFGKEFLMWMLPYANDNFLKKSLEYSLILFSTEDITFKSPKNITDLLTFANKVLPLVDKDNKDPTAIIGFFNNIHKNWKKLPLNAQDTLLTHLGNIALTLPNPHGTFFLGNLEKPMVNNLFEKMLRTSVNKPLTDMFLHYSLLNSQFDMLKELLKHMEPLKVLPFAPNVLLGTNTQNIIAILDKHTSWSEEQKQVFIPSKESLKKFMDKSEWTANKMQRLCNIPFERTSLSLEEQSSIFTEACLKTFLKLIETSEVNGIVSYQKKLSGISSQCIEYLKTIPVGSIDEKIFVEINKTNLKSSASPTPFGYQKFNRFEKKEEILSLLPDVWLNTFRLLSSTVNPNIQYDDTAPIVPTFVVNSTPKTKKTEKEAEQKIRILLEKHRLLEEVATVAENHAPLKKRKM